MRDIFYELIDEAANGRVSIDHDDWPIGFNSNINGVYRGSDYNLSTLVINNEDEFFRYLETYINKELEINRKHMPFSTDRVRNHIKTLMAYLFVNMSTEDFLHPVECIKRRIEFLEDTTFSLFDERFDFKQIPDSQLTIRQNIQSVYMETPYIIDMRIIQDGKAFRFPYISYGICEEDGEKVCYIYSIMNHNGEDNDNELSKKVNRLLYKLNKGVYDSESQEYKDYKEGKSDYYPENISDVTPSFVFAAVTFLTMLKSRGIEKVKIVPYLPVRFNSRAIAAQRTEDPNIRKQREERNKKIQTNATEKFIRTFRRAAYHMEGLEIISYPYEVDENMTMNISDDDINNELLQDVSDQIISHK